MAQTTTAFVKSEYQVEVSNDLVTPTWTDISGWSTTVDVSGGERTNSETHTADGDVPIAVAGKRAAQQVTVNVVYTEGATDAFKIVYAAYLANAGIGIRYSPKGGATGTKRYFGSNAAGTAQILCPILNCTPPSMDAGSGDVTMAEFTLLVPQLVEETIS